MKTKVKIGTFFPTFLISTFPKHPLILSELFCEVEEIQAEKNCSKKEAFQIVQSLREKELKEKTEAVESLPIFKERMRMRLSIDYIEEELMMISKVVDSGYFDE